MPRGAGQGARSAGWVQVTATLIKIVPLIAVVLLVAVRVGSGTPAEPLAAVPVSTLPAGGAPAAAAGQSTASR